MILGAKSRTRIRSNPRITVHTKPKEGGTNFKPKVQEGKSIPKVKLMSTLLKDLKAHLHDDSSFKMECPENLSELDVAGLCESMNEEPSCKREWRWILKTEDQKRWMIFFPESHQHRDFSALLDSGIHESMSLLKSNSQGLSDYIPVSGLLASLDRGEGNPNKVPDGGLAWNRNGNVYLCIEVGYGHEKTLNSMLEEAEMYRDQIYPNHQTLQYLLCIKIYDMPKNYSEKGLVFMLFRFSTDGQEKWMTLEKVESFYILTEKEKESGEVKKESGVVKKKLEDELDWLVDDWEPDQRTNCDNIDWDHISTTECDNYDLHFEIPLKPLLPVRATLKEGTPCPSFIKIANDEPFCMIDLKWALKNFDDGKKRWEKVGDDDGTYIPPKKKRKTSP